MNTHTTTVRSLNALLLLGVTCTLNANIAYAQDVKLTRAVMAKGVKEAKTGPSQPVGATSVFKPGDRKIYCLYSLNKPIKGYGRSVWTAIEVETLKPNTVIYDAKTDPLPNFQFGKFSISNSMDWPRGQYKVAVYANTKYLKTLYFSVK